MTEATPKATKAQKVDLTPEEILSAAALQFVEAADAYAKLDLTQTTHAFLVSHEDGDLRIRYIGEQFLSLARA